MRRALATVTSVMLLAGLVACQRGNDASQTPAASQPAAPAGQSPSPAAGDGGRSAGAASSGAGAPAFARGMEEMTRGLQQALGGSGTPVEPVHFKELQALFPDLDGWEKGKPTGQKMATGLMQFSQAHVVYRSGRSKITAQITDTANHRALMGPFLMATTLGQGYEKETETGFERMTKLLGHPATEKRNNARMTGDLTLLVGTRYLYSLRGVDIPDNAALHRVAAGTDLAKLGAMK